MFVFIREDSSDDETSASGGQSTGKRATAAGVRVAELARECGLAVSESDLEALRSLVPDRGALRKTRERTHSASKTEKSSTVEQPPAPLKNIDSDDALSYMEEMDNASLPEFALV